MKFGIQYDSLAVPRPERMAATLARLGVTHVYRPNYSIPPIYNSALMPLLADTRLSRLLHSDGHYAVFALSGAAGAPGPARAAQPSIQTWDIAPRNYPWTGSAGPASGAFGALCRTVDIPVISSDPQPTVRACKFIPQHRAIYISGVGNAIQVEEKPETFLKLPSTSRYRYTAKVSGRGHIRMLIHERQPTWVSDYIIDEGMLTEAGKTFTRIFQIPRDVTFIRAGFWVDGAGEIRIHDFKLEALQSSE